MGCGRPSLSFSTGPKFAGCSLQTPPNAPKLPHRLLELPRNLPNRLLELPNYGPWQAKSFLCYRPDNGGCSLQTLQTLRNFQTGPWSCQTMGCGRPSLVFSTGPKLPDAPFKPSKRSETSKPALGAAKLWAVAGQVLPFLPARNCNILPSNPPNAPKLPNRLLELPRNLLNRLLELPNYGLWQAKSCLFYRPETAGCSLQTLQRLRNFHTGSWSCHETCQTGSWSCQTMGRGRPSLSFATGPIMADAPFKPSKRSETSKTAPGAATKPAKPALGAAIPWAVAGQVFPFLPARKLPDAPFKPSKRSETSTPAPGAATKPAKPSLGAAKLWAVAGQVFPFLPARDCRMLPQAHLQAVPRARQPVLIASATLTNHLRCSGESPTAVPDSAASVARTDCTTAPDAAGGLSSGIFSAVAAPATRAVAASSHHHLPPAVIASAHHLPPPLIASPRSSVGPLRQHQWTLGLITCVGTQAETFRVTKRTPGSTLAPTGHPCSGLVRVIPCAGCHLCAGACYCMRCANCNRII